MKKIKLLLIPIICLISLLSFTGCGKNKTAISAKDFTEKLEDKGYIIQESTTQYSANNEIKESYIALSEDYDYQIEFIILESESDASNMYSHNKRKFEKEKENSNAKAHSEVNLANYSKYTLIVNGEYKVLSRIENTLIYIDADSEYKDEIDEVLEDIKY